MKINARYTIVISAIAMMLLLVPSMLSGQRAVEQRQRVMRPVTIDKVYFSRMPQTISYRIPDDLKTLPVLPGLFTSQMRLAAINKIRQNIALPALFSIPPAHVILRPEAPKSGKSYYAIHDGGNFPDKCPWPVYAPSFAEGIPFSWTRKFGYMYFLFNTIPNKTYMVDLSVSSLDNTKPIELSGVYTGTVKSQNGHIIIGFTANKSESPLSLMNPLSNIFFFRCEVTQVN